MGDEDLPLVLAIIPRAAALSGAALRAEENAELAARLARVTQQLNESLDEIRCELCDLPEDEGE